MINAGIIGLGPVWETRYRPALESLSNRVRVVAVFDPVEERAIAAAKELGAQNVPGIFSLTRRCDLDAALILGKDWTNLAALKFLCEHRRPAYIAGSLGHEIPAIGDIHLLALSEGLTFMPEFSRRYTPATFRLKELIATKLGTVTQINCSARLPHPKERLAIPGQVETEDFLIGLFDWCLTIVTGRPVELESLPIDDSEGTGWQARIRFESADENRFADLKIYRTEIPEEAHSQLLPGTVRMNLSHEHGEVSLRTSDEIIWYFDGIETVESLTADRPDAEVMLDHFFRRVVGGLIPVADLSDICRAINVFRAWEGSKVVDIPVRIPGQ